LHPSKGINRGLGTRARGKETGKVKSKKVKEKILSFYF
jgi:hypothetical protein